MSTYLNKLNENKEKILRRLLKEEDTNTENDKAGTDEKENFGNTIRETMQNEMKKEIEIVSYSDDQNTKTARFFFTIPLESTNLYFQMEYSDNILQLYLNLDSKSKSELENNTSGNVQPKPIPLIGNDDIPKILSDITRISETTIKKQIMEHFGIV